MSGRLLCCLIALTFLTPVGGWGVNSSLLDWNQSVAWSQQATPLDGPEVNRETTDDANGSAPGLTLASLNPSSKTEARAGRWWAMSVTVMNSADTPKVAKVVAAITDEGQPEFSITLNVAPNSSTNGWLWIKLPDVQPGSAINLNASLREIIGDREVDVRKEGERSIHDLRIPPMLEGKRIVSAFIENRSPTLAKEWEWRTDTEPHDYLLAVASRESDDLSRVMTLMRRLPADIREWDAIDNVFINDISSMNDPAGIACLRHWLAEGGRAWIALDKVPLEAIEPLLGDVWQATSFGTVELTEYDIRTKLLPESGNNPQHVDDRYHPAQLVMLDQQGGEVTHHVNQWPAAIRVTLGKGEVWLTTIDASAWYEPITYGPDDPGGIRPANRPTEMANQILQSFQPPLSYAQQTGTSDQSTNGSDRPAFVSTAGAAIHVGYPVPSRSAVFGSLGFFVIATVVAGVVLWRRERLELTGWCIPAIAFLSATPLFLFAQSGRTQVEDTIAHVQYADLQPESGHAVVDQQSVIYISTPRELNFQLPLESTVELFEASSITPYRWGQLAATGTSIEVPRWPTGIQPVHSTFTTPIATTEATGRFSDAGLTITLPSTLPDGISDPIVVMPPSRFSVPQSIDDGGYVISPNVPSDSEIRMGSGILDPTQLHHQDVYRSLLDPERESAFVAQRSVLVWASPWPSPIDDQPNVAIKGESLNRLRLRYLATAVGTTVAIPPTSFDVSPVNAGIGNSMSGKIASGQPHAPMTTPRRWVLKWQLPEAVLPLQIDSVKFAINLNAPRRTVTISSVSGEPANNSIARPATTVLGTFTDSVKTVLLDIDPADLAYQVEQGSLFLEFAVSDIIREPEPNQPGNNRGQPGNNRGRRRGPIVSAADEDNASWQVFRPELTVSGTVLSR